MEGDRIPGSARYVTFDVDVFDWSIVSATGTPEPGGIKWHEALQLLPEVFGLKDVVGADFVELAPRGEDLTSPFAVAKLVTHVIGLKWAGGAASTKK